MKTTWTGWRKKERERERIRACLILSLEVFYWSLLPSSIEMLRATHNMDHGHEIKSIRTKTVQMKKKKKKKQNKGKREMKKEILFLYALHENRTVSNSMAIQSNWVDVRASDNFLLFLREQPSDFAVGNAKSWCWWYTAIERFSFMAQP